MKILLLGPNGQLGTDIQKHFGKDKSIELHSIDRKILDVHQHSQIIPTLEKYDFDILINTIAYNRVDDAESRAIEAFSVNAQAVKQLAMACELKKAVFVQVSTDYVFNGQSKRPYVESDGTGPVSVYGASKSMGEQMALLFNPKTYLMRVASLFGVAGSSGKGGNFIETMMRLSRENNPIHIVNDITMSPTATAWVAEAILQIIHKKPEYGIYHSVNSGQATWYDFACEIFNLTQVGARANPVSSDQFPTLALRPSFSVLDNSKLQNVIGEIPSWKSAVQLYLKEKGYIS